MTTSERRDGAPRLRSGFNMAAILLSSVDGRAIEHRGCPRADEVGGRSCEFQQMARVGVGRHAGAKHRVVARLFAVVPQARQSEPDQRVEPAARCVALRRAIWTIQSGTRNVRELVAEHRVCARSSFQLRACTGSTTRDRKSPHVASRSGSWFEGA